MIDTTVCKLTVEGVCYFKIVMVIMGGINALITFIVCAGVKKVGICETSIITVDYFAHKPELTVPALAEMLKLSEKILIHAVCNIKS